MHTVWHRLRRIQPKLTLFKQTSRLKSKTVRQFIHSKGFVNYKAEIKKIKHTKTLHQAAFTAWCKMYTYKSLEIKLRRRFIEKVLNLLRMTNPTQCSGINCNFWTIHRLENWSSCYSSRHKSRKDQEKSGATLFGNRKMRWKEPRTVFGTWETRPGIGGAVAE